MKLWAFEIVILSELNSLIKCIDYDYVNVTRFTYSKCCLLPQYGGADIRGRARLRQDGEGLH